MLEKFSVLSKMSNPKESRQSKASEAHNRYAYQPKDTTQGLKEDNSFSQTPLRKCILTTKIILCYTLNTK